MLADLKGDLYDSNEHTQKPLIVNFVRCVVSQHLSHPDPTNPVGRHVSQLDGRNVDYFDEWAPA